MHYYIMQTSVSFYYSRGPCCGESELSVFCDSVLSTLTPNPCPEPLAVIPQKGARGHVSQSQLYTSLVLGMKWTFKPLTHMYAICSKKKTAT